MYKYFTAAQTSFGGGFLKNQTKHRSRFRGFYTALAISLVMIGAACIFAYRQTSQTLEDNLDSLTEQMEIPAVTTAAEAPAIGMQTNVAKQTTVQTETVYVPETAAPAETAMPEPEPEPEETPTHQQVPPLSDFSILNPFSDGELVKSETTGTWQTHNGVDLSCETGSEVFAIDTGTVTEISNDALWGYTVTIDHDNGLVSRYCGLDGSVEVREGDTVQSGQKIGVTGNVPDIESALEPHLHLEVRKSGEYVDPTAYFGG